MTPRPKSGGGAVTEPPTLINFTINSNSYQAEEGMTWEQWVNSSYNTAGYFTTIANDTKVLRDSGGRDVDYEGTVVHANDVILSNVNYTHSTSGAPDIS